jgi:hypothetical protein
MPGQRHSQMSWQFERERILTNHAVEVNRRKAHAFAGVAHDTSG